jgi:hypothetical protein
MRANFSTKVEIYQLKSTFVVDECHILWKSIRVMNALTFDYSEFSSAALIAIFRLADLLQITPKRACEVYLAEMANRVAGKSAA